jgi:PRD domain protein EF_0829/AHA_3910
MKELTTNHLNLTDLQLTVLANHLGEMVMRSKDNQSLDPVDESLFSGVSDTALNIAKDITNKIGNLAPSEPFVLSIHFENAIENN